MEITSFLLVGGRVLASPFWKTLNYIQHATEEMSFDFDKAGGSFNLGLTFLMKTVFPL
jgi:hypothetical protein